MNCCEHRGLDHENEDGAGGPEAGARCTVPGCGCPGWAPGRKAGGKRPTETPAKIRALRAEGLSTAEIRERLGVSVSLVTKSLRGLR